MQKLRKIIQTTVFIGMFLIPLFNLLEIYFIKGTFISMDIGSLGIADPVMIFQAVLSGMGAAGVLFTSILLPLLLVIFLGRVWCSWACPYTLILQWAEKIPFLKKRLAANKAKMAKGAKVFAWRYLIFIGFFGLVGIAGVPILHLFAPPAVLSTQALLLIKTFTLSVEILFIMIILVVDLFFAYRFTCRYLCPTGTCLSLFQNRQIGMHIDYAGDCIHCQACIKKCPMGLDPTGTDINLSKEAASRLCYNCGECIDVCPDKTKPLTWKFGK